VAKPRRLPATRRALPDTRLAEINEVAATTGDDPEMDTLILRLHTETACRRGGALALRPWILVYPQPLLPAASRSVSAATSALTGGRPSGSGESAFGQPGGGASAGGARGGQSVRPWPSRSPIT
jgi:hypothetical protein